ncbi:MAG: tyrosine recombinase [Saprospiraceae bacterium]|nr:tyrosine recombinase [Saprospiraceae bacterium]
MDWKSAMAGYKSSLALEQGLSSNSVKAYLTDVGKLRDFALSHLDNKSPLQIDMNDLLAFVAELNTRSMDERSQARLISGLRSFFGYLLTENLIQENPTEHLISPRLGQYLPDVLSIDEIESCIYAVQYESEFYHRDRTILELLYACGLRVSELVELKWSQIHWDPGLVKVHGKGNKERIVPIGSKALKALEELKSNPPHTLQRGQEDFIFINCFGKKLSRIGVFKLVKKYASLAGITKSMSPHTFRHSFATHLVEAGANLRIVQALLGHESITTTEIYTHLDLNYLRETILQFHPAQQWKL